MFFVGVLSCYIYTFYFSVVTYMFIRLEHVGIMSNIFVNMTETLQVFTPCTGQADFVLQCVKRKSPLLLIITLMLKYYCSTNHQSCFTTYLCDIAALLQLQPFPRISQEIFFVSLATLEKSSCKQFLASYAVFCLSLLSDKKCKMVALDV